MVASSPPIFLKKRRSRMGIQTAIVTLILVMIGIAVAMTVASVIYSNIAAYSGRASIRVIEAKAYMQPSATTIYFSVKVRNDGGAKITNIAVEASTTGASWTSVGSISALDPGQEGTVSASIALSGAAQGTYIMIRARGTAPSGGTVEDVIRVVVV